LGVIVQCLAKIEDGHIFIAGDPLAGSYDILTMLQGIDRIIDDAVAPFTAQ
jgi:hypothetical protein